MRYTANFLAFLVGVGTLGCASLRVEVAVLDPRVAESEMDRQLVRDVFPRVAALTDRAIRAEVDQLREAHRSVFRETRDTYQQEAAKLPDPEKRELNEIANALLEDFNRVIDPVYDSTIDDLLGIRAELSRVDGTADSAKRWSAVASLLRRRQTVIDGLLRFVEGETPGLPSTGAFSPDLIQVTETKPVAEAWRKRSIVQGERLDNSPLAHSIVIAPDTAWAPQFNRVLGKGLFGDVDLAVVVDPSGEFTLKGLSFDPSAVARTASKATVQALLITAQIAGVPVKGKANPTTTSEPSPGPNGVDAANRAAKARALAREQHAAITAIAWGLLAQRAALLSSDPGVRSEAVRAAKATFEAHKTRLDPGATTTKPNQ